MTDRKLDVWDYPFDGRTIRVEIRMRRPEGGPGLPDDLAFAAKHDDPKIDEEAPTLVGLGDKIGAALTRASRTRWTPYLHVHNSGFGGRSGSVACERVEIGTVEGEPGKMLYRQPERTGYGRTEAAQLHIYEGEFKVDTVAGAFLVEDSAFARDEWGDYRRGLDEARAAHDRREAEMAKAVMDALRLREVDRGKLIQRGHAVATVLDVRQGRATVP